VRSKTSDTSLPHASSSSSTSNLASSSSPHFGKAAPLNSRVWNFVFSDAPGANHAKLTVSLAYEQFEPLTQYFALTMFTVFNQSSMPNSSLSDSSVSSSEPQKLLAFQVGLFFDLFELGYADLADRLIPLPTPKFFDEGKQTVSSASVFDPGTGLDAHFFQVYEIDCDQ
jgi:hypothetical protein